MLGLAQLLHTQVNIPGADMVTGNTSSRDSDDMGLGKIIFTSTLLSRLVGNYNLIVIGVDQLAAALKLKLFVLVWS